MAYLGCFVPFMGVTNYNSVSMASVGFWALTLGIGTFIGMFAKGKSCTATSWLR